MRDKGVYGVALPAWRSHAEGLASRSNGWRSASLGNVGMAERGSWMRAFCSGSGTWLRVQGRGWQPKGIVQTSGKASWREPRRVCGRLQVLKRSAAMRAATKNKVVSAVRKRAMLPLLDHEGEATT